MGRENVHILHVKLISPSSFIFPPRGVPDKTVSLTCKEGDTISEILLQCTPDNGETVKREFQIKGKVPRERIFYVVNHFG